MINAADIWRMIIIPNGIIILIGLASVGLTAHLSKAKYIPINFLPLSYLAGETIIVLLLQFESFLYGQFWWPLFPVTAVLASLYLIFTFWRIKIKFKRPSIFWLYLFSLLIIVFFTIPNLRLAYFNLLSAWDARSIWFFHGKAFYYDNKIDRSFLTNPAYGPEWSHPDYPPAIGLLACFHAHYLGRWHEILNKSFIYFHWLFSLLSLFSLFQENSLHLSASLVATIIFQGLFSLNAHWGLADSFWAISLLLGILLIGKALIMMNKDKEVKNCYFLAFFPLALAALTKQEGTIAVILLLSVASIILLTTNGRSLRSFWPLCLLVMLVILPWYIFTFIHGIHSEPRLSPLGFLRFDLMTLVKRSQMIFTLPFKMKLVPLPLFIFLSFCLLSSFLHLWLNCKRIKLCLPEILLVGTFLGYGFILFLIYLSTPHPLNWHLWTSLERTIIPLEMIAITLLIFITRSPA